MLLIVRVVVIITIDKNAIAIIIVWNLIVSIYYHTHSI